MNGEKRLDLDIQLFLAGQELIPAVVICVSETSHPVTARVVAGCIHPENPRRVGPIDDLIDETRAVVKIRVGHADRVIYNLNSLRDRVVDSQLKLDLVGGFLEIEPGLRGHIVNDLRDGRPVGRARLEAAARVIRFIDDDIKGERHILLSSG